MILPAGATSIITYWNLEVTGLTITDLDASYVRDQAAAVKNDLTAHGAVTDAWDDNEAIEVDATNCPGLYRVDFPDAAFVAGVNRVQLCVHDGANGTIAPQFIEVELEPEVTLANSANHGGAVGVLTLKQIVVSNDSGVGVTIDGTAQGMTVTGVGGAQFTGTNGSGITAQGGSGAPGILGTGGTGAGQGIKGLGGTGGGAGIQGMAQANNDAGQELIAHGTGADLLLTTSGTIEDGSGNPVPVDAIQISGDATAADNLELGYDGVTGLTGDTFPATQAQVGNLSTGSAGVSTIAISTEATLPSVVGTPTNTFAVTSQLDGIYHSWVPSGGGELEFAYNFNIGPNASPTEIIWNGFARSNNDEVAVYARNWVGGSWDQIKTIEATAQATDQELDFVLTTAHVNTGANSGDVRIRFVSTGGSIITAFATNRILCGFTITNQSVGYANGQIWVDTNGSNTNTVSFVDGVADNPAGSWANGVTLSTQTDLTDFHVLNGSTITLTGTSDNFSIFGDNWTLALAGRSVNEAYFQGAHVSGIGTSATEVHYEGCDVATMSVQNGHFDFCSFDGEVTHTLAGDYNYHDCHSGVPGPLGPTFAKTAGQAITAQWRSWKGSMNLTGLEVGDTLTIGGDELGTIDLGSPAGAPVVEIRGIYKELANTGNAAVNLDGAILAADIALILEDTDATQSRVDDMTEDDGGTWRLTANAMENLYVVDMDQVEGTPVEHSLCCLVLSALESSRSGTVWTIRKTGGTTYATKTLTTDADTAPVTGVS